MARLSIVDSLKRKTDLLAAGMYQTSKGFVVRLVEMNDAHLVNALLKSLSRGEPESITSPLAAEVKRRNLETYAREIARQRDGTVI